MDQISIQLEGLSRLLQGPCVIEKPVTKQQYKLMASKLFGDSFKEEFEDPTQHVLLFAWRISRILAIGYNLINDDESLQDIPPGKSWSDITWCRRVPNQMIPSAYHDKQSGLVPSQSTNEDFAELLRVFSHRLCVAKGSQSHPFSGRVALKFLSDTENLHHLYPHKDDIVDFEESVLQMITDNMVTKAHHNTLRIIKKDYGLTHDEVTSIVKTVHNRLATYADQDTYTAKGLIVARLEKIAERAEFSGDIRAETAAVKSLAVIHGIVQNTGGRNTNEDFVEAVRCVTGEDDDDPLEAQLIGE